MLLSKTSLKTQSSIVAILTIFNDLWSVFIIFYAYISIKLDMHQKHFCAFFCRYALGKMQQLFFYQLQHILVVKKIPVWRKFRASIYHFLRLLIVKTTGEEKIDIKVAILNKI